MPVESVTLDLPETVSMHHLVYSLGSGDNYMGINQSALNEGLKISPENSAAIRWNGLAMTTQLLIITIHTVMGSSDMGKET